MKPTALSILLALLIPIPAFTQYKFLPNWSLSENQPNVAPGGRTNAVAVHPSNRELMFAASDSGGLFQSASGGLYWTHVRGLPRIFTQAVAYLPASPNVVLVSAKSHFNPSYGGGGVWRSTDGGQTWDRAQLDVPQFNGWLDAYEISAVGNTVAVATSEGVFVSTNGGSTWEWSDPYGGFDRRVFSVLVTPGSPQRIYAGGPSGVRLSTIPVDGSWVTPTVNPVGGIWVVHAFGQSPLSPDHAFVANGHLLFRTEDGGLTWTGIPSAPQGLGCGGTPFIKAALRGTSTDGFLDLYYGNTCDLHRLTVRVDGSPLDVSGPWDPLWVDHRGTRDLALFGTEPVLLASNGGLHDTANLGQVWTFVGGGSAGYNALQIAEVKGQYVSDPENPRRGPVLDLYFGTQDNGLFAIDPSGNELARHAAAGFFIDAERKVPSPAASKITFAACNSCRPQRSERYFANALDVLHSGLDTAAPVLLRQGQYLQNVPAGLDVTDDPDLFTWQPFAEFEEEPVGIPKVAYAGAGGDAVVYQPFGSRRAAELLRIERFGGNVNVVRPVMNSMAVNPLMPGAFYPAYGVDTGNWEHLIATDIRNDLMMYTTDGGHNWAPLLNLTDQVTYGGQLRFSRNSPGTGDTLPLVTAVSFHPTRPSQVLVGTSEGGIYYSANRGVTWRRINHSENASYVTSFFWASLNSVYVSTFGRGLWLLRNRPIAPLELFDELCGTCDVLSDDGSPDRPPFDDSVLVFDGRILGVRRSEKGQLREVFITRGSSFVFTGDPKDLQEDIVVTESDGKGSFEPPPDHPKGWMATGVVLTSDDAIAGTVYAESELALPPDK